MSTEKRVNPCANTPSKAWKNVTFSHLDFKLKSIQRASHCVFVYLFVYLLCRINTCI